MSGKTMLEEPQEAALWFDYFMIYSGAPQNIAAKLLLRCVEKVLNYGREGISQSVLHD